MPPMERSDRASRLEAARALAREAGLGGWLLYDFRGQNPLATGLLGLGGEHLTRRWFLYLPAAGRPTPDPSPNRGGHLGKPARGRGRAAGLQRPRRARHLIRETLSGAGRVAMEYSPRGEVPYVSKVDAGTLERVREAGVEVVSSESLLQRLLAWTPEDRLHHDRAVAGRRPGQGPRLPARARPAQAWRAVTELEAQGSSQRRSTGRASSSTTRPSSPLGPTRATPTTSRTRALTAASRGDGGPRGTSGRACRVFPTPTHLVGFAGEPSREYLRVWDAVRDARDLALETFGAGFRRRARRLGGGPGGPRPHRGARLRSGRHPPARPQTSGWSSRPGANLDDLETHDTRRLVAGLAVTVEPGSICPSFGVRSEVTSTSPRRAPSSRRRFRRGLRAAGASTCTSASASRPDRMGPVRPPRPARPLWRRWPFWTLLIFAVAAAVQFWPGRAPPAGAPGGCRPAPHAEVAAEVGGAARKDSGAGLGRGGGHRPAAGDVFGESFLYAAPGPRDGGSWAEVWATSAGDLDREAQRERWRAQVKALGLRLLEARRSSPGWRRTCSTGARSSTRFGWVASGCRPCGSQRARSWTRPGRL
jgi:hypothetical protein